MGYTTEFDGRFDLDKLPTAEAIVRINQIWDDPDTAEDNPGSYCQWRLTPDCMHLEWDRNEKFYNYVEWLQYLMDNVLTPIGVSVSGTVSFSGERSDDVGVVTIQDGKAVALTRELIADNLEELKKFKAFILARDDADDILSDWRDNQK